MKKLIVFALFLIAGIGLFLWLVNHIGWAEVWEITRSFGAVKGLAVLALTILMAVFGAWRWSVILRSQGYKVPFFTVSELYLAGFALNFFIPMVILVGELFKAYFLKERKEVPFSQGMASVISEKILDLTTHFAVIVVGLIVLLFAFGGVVPKFLSIVMTGVAALGFVVAFFYLKTFRGESIIKFFYPNSNGSLHDVEKEIIQFFHWKNPAFRKSIALSVLRSMAAFARTALILIFLGVKLKLLSVIPILGFYYVALLTPIPASLGSHDALQVLAFQAFDMPSSFGAAFALIVRITEAAVGIVGTVVLTIGGARMAMRIVSNQVAKIFFRS
ncbi:MAG: flippase-like domain-containing protein [Candidatus Wildermuthbacteria bacterium]|nr:flippase-like domain-containing protein [Candidatus Wildermuthbacteria bacterium]